MRISDWSSDVCSSDLPRRSPGAASPARRRSAAARRRPEPGSRWRGAPARQDRGSARRNRRAPRAARSEARRGGKVESVRVDLGGSRNLKKKKTIKGHSQYTKLSRLKTKNKKYR